MGQIKTLTDAAWRDYNTDGVPSSGTHSPEKSAIRTAMRKVDELVDLNSSGLLGLSTHEARLTKLEAGANFGSVAKSTWAALDAITGDFDGQRGEVFGPDSGTHADAATAATVDNVGTYSWDATNSRWDWLSAASAAAVSQTVSELAELFPVDQARNLYDPANPGAAMRYIYQTGGGGLGVPLAVTQDYVLSGLIDVEAGKSYIVDLSATDDAWILFSATNVWTYTTSGTPVAYTATGVVGATRQLIYTPASDGKFAFALKFAPQGVFDTTVQKMTTADFDKVRTEISITVSPKASTLRDYDADAPVRTAGPTLNILARQPKALAVAKHGAVLYVRSHLDASNDALRRIRMFDRPNPERNVGVDWWSVVKIAATADDDLMPGLFEEAFNALDRLVIESDDMPAVMINGMYLGGQHGVLSTQITTPSAHGKVNADIGSTFTDGAAKTWVLTRIVNSTKLVVTAANTGADGNNWVITTAVPTGATLTHVSGGSSSDISISATAQYQLRPFTADVMRRVFLDNGHEITDDDNGLHYTNGLTLEVSYAIPNVAGLLADLIAKVGNTSDPNYTHADIARQARVTIRYHINAEGVVSGIYTYEALQPHTLTELIGVQHQVMYFAGAETLHQYVTGVNASVAAASGGGAALNFQVGADISANASQYDFNQADWTDAAKPPTTMVQEVRSSGVAVRSHAIGYLEEVGDAAPADRVANLGGGKRACFLSAAEKQYMQAATSKAVTAGNVFEVGVMFGFFDPSADNTGWLNITADVGADAYLHWQTNDTHATNVWVPVPARLRGRRIERIDSNAESAAVTLKSSIVGTNGVLVTTSGRGGMVLRLH